MVPTLCATNPVEDLQHPHLAPSAQSLLLQATSYNPANSNGFVSPKPMDGYNPVFQQIYHHSVQPKPAHFATTAINTPHRQFQIPAVALEQKQLTAFQNQTAIVVASSAAAATVDNAGSNYYSENNSSSSGASPSPAVITSLTPTTLSWNTSTMLSNSFLTVRQQQQQQEQSSAQLNVATEKMVTSKDFTNFIEL